MATSLIKDRIFGSKLSTIEVQILRQRGYNQSNSVHTNLRKEQDSHFPKQETYQARSLLESVLSLPESFKF